MQQKVLMNEIYPIGDSGICVNPHQFLNAVDGWIKDTPDDVKIKQIKQFATIGLIISVAVLIVGSIAR